LFAVCRLLVVGGGEEGPKKRNRPKKVQIKKIEKTVFKFLKPEKRSAAARNRTHAAGPKKQMSYRRATAPNQDSPVTVRVETVDG
jgi:BRCT domain type II-containing protein